jgi:chondroitin 4-sulfotransferase 11
MISHPFRCLYIHIPKTGGNSVNRMFGVKWEDHKDLGRYAAELEPAVFAHYYKFAIVRNPWERIFSDYNYQKKKSRERDSKLFLYDAAGRVRTFRTWLEAVMDQPHRYAPHHWGGEVSTGIHRWSPQVDWISLEGRVAVDRVLRLESIDDDLAAVSRHLHLPATRLPHRNRRWHWHYSWYYDRTSRDLVASYYERDIAAFGYRFESANEQAAAFIRTCLTPLSFAPRLVGRSATVFQPGPESIRSRSSSQL